MLETVVARQITPADIMPIEQYGAERKERRRKMSEIKRDRRIEVGPHAMFYFESYETMWHQIHEMLYIEKGGDDQVPDELAAFNPLIPQGRELVATVMFEIEDPRRRAAILARMGGVEDTMSIRFGGHTIMGVPEDDVDRTNAAGKASSVQFVHFPFTDEQVEAFRKPDTRVEVAIEHPGYGHIAVMPERIRESLATDFS